MNRSFRGLLAVFGVCLLLASCNITKPYKSSDPPNGNLYRDPPSHDSGSFALLSWKQLFQDSSLVSLIEEGIANNRDLKMAFARVSRAEAYYAQSRAAFWPSLNGNVGVEGTRLSETTESGTNRSSTQFQLAVSSGWEVDLWGKLRSNKRANLASLLQAEAATRTVQSRLVTTIANYYYDLLALDQQLLITQQTVHYWDTTVQVMRALKTAARVTEAAVVQSEAQRYGAAVTIPDLQQAIMETENALCILLGSVPRSIHRSSLYEQNLPEALETGVPAELLSNRPDVQEAEYNFRYAFEQTNVARTYFYPSLSITAAAGFSSLSFDDLFAPASFIATLAAGLAQPIFNKRANVTQLEVSRALQEEALYNFQNVLLVAGQEVSDALSLYRRGIEKKNIRGYQIEALTSSVNYSFELLENGFANYTEVINARQLLLQAELGSVNDELQTLRATVNLYRSLGGGWK